VLAGVCRLLVVLAVTGPPADVLPWKSVEGKSQQVVEEFVRDRDATVTFFSEVSLKLDDVQSHAAARVRAGTFAANALSLTTEHVLANGLRAPLTC
jgi:hypothetical protein